MSASDALRALVATGTPAAVLPACRLESGALDRFGSEAVADQFARAPLDLADARVVSSDRQVALATPREAVFADVYDARLGRLWRIGQPAPGPGEPALAVAFDPDLHQRRGDVFMSPTDHPELAADAAALVVAHGMAVLQTLHATTFRARAFVTRAFGNRTQGAALYALHALGHPVREPSLRRALAWWDGDDLRLVVDEEPVRTVVRRPLV